MISLRPLIQHLEKKPADFHGVWFRKVEGAAEYARIKLDALPLPAAWIVRDSDKVQHAGERAELVDLAFDVVIAIENARAHYSGETDDILLKYRKAVYSLLTGWEIETDVTPIKFGGGRVLEYTKSDIFWRDRYEFDALITNYLPDPPAFDRLNYTGEKL